MQDLRLFDVVELTTDAPGDDGTPFRAGAQGVLIEFLAGAVMVEVEVAEGEERRWEVVTIDPARCKLVSRPPTLIGRGARLRDAAQVDHTDPMRGLVVPAGLVGRIVEDLGAAGDGRRVYVVSLKLPAETPARHHWARVTLTEDEFELVDAGLAEVVQDPTIPSPFEH